MSSYRSRAQQRRDDAIVDEVNGMAKADRALMCRAAGCPNRWSVNSEGRVMLCSAHAWSPAREWPQITQAQNEAADARSRGVARAPVAAPVDRQQIADKLRQFVAHARQASEQEAQP